MKQKRRDWPRAKVVVERWLPKISPDIAYITAGLEDGEPDARDIRKGNMRAGYNIKPVERIKGKWYGILAQKLGGKKWVASAKSRIGYDTENEAKLAMGQRWPHVAIWNVNGYSGAKADFYTYPFYTREMEAFGRIADAIIRKKKVVDKIEVNKDETIEYISEVFEGLRRDPAGATNRVLSLYMLRRVQRGQMENSDGRYEQQQYRLESGPDEGNDYLPTLRNQQGVDDSERETLFLTEGHSNIED